MITDFCNELNRYLQHNYSLKRPPARCNFTTVTAYRSKFDLYFRYKPENEKTLTIARIGFKEEKKGNGTKLLEFLSEIAQSHDIETITIESVNENSYNFGIKMGFTDIGNSKMMISSRDLIERFKK